jgi:hypothetical protein
MVLNASQGGPSGVSNVPPDAFSWPGTLVGFVLVTYYWWPAWVQLVRHGRPGTAPRQTWDERIAERVEEAKRNRPQV